MKQKVFIGLLMSYFLYSATVWINADPRKTKPLADEIAIKKGHVLWQQYNCQGCHQLYGLGGYLGPDLTNIYSDSLKGDAYIKVFIQYGSARMPKFNLTDQQCRDILLFLKWVDKSGRTRVSAEQVSWTGNYNF